MEPKQLLKALLEDPDLLPQDTSIFFTTVPDDTPELSNKQALVSVKISQSLYNKLEAQSNG